MPSTCRVARAVALVLAGAVVAGCAGSAHPQVADDQLVCASAAETRLTVARDDAGRAGADDGERAAAVLREVATLQFALEGVAPSEPALATGRDEVVAATDLAEAVAAVVALDDACAAAEVPRALEGAEHTTAACTQLGTIGDRSGDLARDEQVRARVRFAVRYIDARGDDLDDELRDRVATLGDALGEDPERAATALEQAVARCEELRGDG